jgi:hypothetical protein
LLKGINFPKIECEAPACLVTKFIVILMVRSNGVFGASNHKAVMKVYPKKRYVKELNFEK